MKLNKGSILKASVEYVKELKRDQRKLALFEANQKAIEAKYQKMLIRIFVSTIFVCNEYDIHVGKMIVMD
jgi:hypothetical protein